MNQTKPTQLIIIGSGPSLSEGISKGLWTQLENRFTIGMNFLYIFSNFTILTFVDWSFYIGNRKKINEPNERRRKHVQNLKSLPFIVGASNKNIRDPYDNTILLKPYHTYYGRKSLKKNLIYKENLSGLFSLTLGINLLNEGTIFLVGFDGGATEWFDRSHAHTHFCQGNPNSIKHDGYGKIGYYEIPGKTEEDYSVYKNDPKIKIYNVSLKSKIPDTVFPKISYERFFKLLKDDGICDQEVLRSTLRTYIIKEVPNNSKEIK